MSNGLCQGSIQKTTTYAEERYKSCQNYVTESLKSGLFSDKMNYNSQEPSVRLKQQSYHSFIGEITLHFMKDWKLRRDEPAQCPVFSFLRFNGYDGIDNIS